MCEAVPPQSLLHARFSAQCVVETCEAPSSFTAAGDSPPGGDSRGAGRREGMKHLMHVCIVLCIV